MTANQSILARNLAQVPLARVSEIIDSIDATILLRRLFAYRLNGGPRTYSIRSFWRAYLLMYVKNYACVNDLINALRDDPRLMELCGFEKLPHRTTFNRFWLRLADHQDLVEDCQIQLVQELKALIPDLGDRVAVDSTTIRTHAHPKRKSPITGQISDPEAGWTRKPSKTDPNENDWYYGFKEHIVVDAVHHVPLTGFTTPANHNDSPTLPKLLDQAASQYGWLKPKIVTADRGYDAESNHEYVLDRGGAFICPMRTIANAKDTSGSVFDRNGVPSCMGTKPMEYVGTHPDKGHLYKCPPGGCHLKQRRGVVYCQDYTWVDWRTEPNKRIHGPVRRGTAEWEELYSERQSIERVFKSMKEFRRLEHHYLRGLKNISLHAAMSVLTYTATLLAQRRAGIAETNWMVSRVA